MQLRRVEKRIKKLFYCLRYLYVFELIKNDACQFKIKYIRERNNFWNLKR